MKLFDWFLATLILFLVGVNFFTLPSAKSSTSQPSHSSLKLKLTNQPDYTLGQIYFDYLNSTKLVLINKLTSQPFTAYLNPHKDYSLQIDLIQKALNRSKIIKRNLLVLDLASPKPYATFQSNY